MSDPKMHQSVSERKSKPATNPNTFKERDNWMRAVLAADLPHAAVRVAIRIAMHLRVETGQCNPACATLAGESRVGERSIYRIVALLERAGWLAVERTKGRHANHYTLRNHDTAMAVLNPDTAMAVLPEPTLPNRTANPDSGVNPTLPYAGRQKAKRKAKRKAESQTLAPDDASLGGKEERSPRGKHVAKPKLDSHAEHDAGFEDFWRVYPKQVDKDAARAEYGKALNRGAEPAAIVAGAKLYAISERVRIERGEDPKYTTHPKNWLKAGRWKDPPPDGVVIDGLTGLLIEGAAAPRRRKLTRWQQIAEDYLAEHGDAIINK
jgi:hypothetical protein